MSKTNTKPEVIDEVINETQATSTEGTEDTPKPKTVKGKVINCAKLNIRQKPDKSASALCQIEKGAELRIDLTESSDKWLKVTTKDKTVGYCMAVYVSYKK